MKLLSTYEPAHLPLLEGGGGEQVSTSSKNGIKSISYSCKKGGGARH